LPASSPANGNHGGALNSVDHPTGIANSPSTRQGQIGAHAVSFQKPQTNQKGGLKGLLRLFLTTAISTKEEDPMNENAEKVVDGFRFLPPSLGAWIGKDIPEEPFSGTIPWKPLQKPICETTFALVTSAGISMKTDPPFDVEREKNEPLWGDPTSRKIPVSADETNIDVNHLHINTDYIKQDINVILPLQRFREFEREGLIGHLAATSYSYYGFQLNPEVLLEQTIPGVVSSMKAEGVEAALLTPA
jgi:D-proline reductase (dithiol) PrdB